MTTAEKAPEVWRTAILDREAFPYEVSDLGHIRRGKNRRGRRLSSFKKGYAWIDLHKNGQIRQAAVHRLVLETFLGSCPVGMEANHIDGDRTNNALDNLEWISHSENQIHSYRIGLQQPTRGEADGNAKLTAKQVRKIRTMYRSGQYTQTELAVIFGISQTHTSDIILRRRWKHLED